MGRLFGTDGVRGQANRELTAHLALELSVAAAHVLGEAGAFSGHRPVAYVGRDPRASGEFLEAAVVAGLASAGVDVVRVGVIPTPGLAYLVGTRKADLGVMLSASHNAMPDNGIKFLQRGGIKLDDVIEDAIEEQLEEEWELPVGGDVGRVTDDFEAVDDYVAHLVSSVGEANLLAPLKVVIDCANGASSKTALDAFAGQGATVIPLHCDPDGLNINDNCGSTHMESLQVAVVDQGADLGIALDGDADRCLAVDAKGELVDGDQIMGILALAMRDQGRLNGDTLVVTVMSNLGLIIAMKEHGIKLDITKVGDRYVLESMNANAFSLGGEQSGHVIMSEFATTGDGVLTGLHLAAQMVRSQRSLADLGAVMTRLPQVMINVKGVDKARAALDPDINAAVLEENRKMAGQGRVLLRPSGTEPVVRVMVEAPTTEAATDVCERLAAMVKDRLAL